MVTVTPEAAELTALSERVQFKAEVRDQNGYLMTEATVAWSSGDPTVATVDSKGLARAVDNGTATLTAKVGTVSGSAIVTVRQEASTVALLPATKTLVKGDTLRLAAVVTDASGYAVTGATLDWASSDTLVARVDGSGLVRAVSVGAVTVTASSGSEHGTALITARGPPLDRDILERLYKVTGGPYWSTDDNWLTDAPLEDWYGVDVDGEGMVVNLRLNSNGLTGPIPPGLGNLANLKELSLWDIGLTGPIPPQLGNLGSLTRLALFDNKLTGPIPAALGNLTNLQELRLHSNDLSGPIASELGDLANLRELSLSRNELTGSIPPGLSGLASLQTLSLDNNALAGPIPSALGNLASLTWLSVSNNDLTGPIPSELASLAHLEQLALSENGLTGPIPSELASLADLEHLALDGNDLTGPIPPVLGTLADLDTLLLDRNHLTGTVPSRIGGLENLLALGLSQNPGLSGVLPGSLAALGRLEGLGTAGTDLCAPSDDDFLVWLEGVHNHRVPLCTGATVPHAYLTQAVQSREFPVPLVAGEEALVRVFVTAERSNAEDIPSVRVTFYRNGTESHVVDIPENPGPIPIEVDEGVLGKSANAVLPGEIVQPGLEMVIEIDPLMTLDPGLGVTTRIPETGRIAVDVRVMPKLYLTMVPFLLSTAPDSSILDAVNGMAEDPGTHELLSETRTLLPVGPLEVTAHEPVLTSSNNALDMILETRLIRMLEGGSGHYMGLFAGLTTVAAGLAYTPGRTSFSIPNSLTMAHELGHNLSLSHAPCGNAPRPDPWFPVGGGSTGAWGYDSRGGAKLVAPDAADLMSYCRPRWISDYHFSNALRFRLSDEGQAAAAVAAAPVRTLLLWGGVDDEGVPFLEPAFIIAALPALPPIGGEYGLTGRSAGGGELFSLSFDMPELADGDGHSSFAFALPVQDGWADALASITLSGPDGSVTLNGASNHPMTILRDPGNGQVRGILRDLSPVFAAHSDAAAALSPKPGLEVLISRGIPDAAAWRR